MTKLVNRAKVKTTTTGTGTLTLGSAIPGYQSFASAGVLNSDVVRYAIEQDAEWEIGTGTYSSAGNTLTRTVTESSNAGSPISLTGNADVYVTAAADDLLQPQDIGITVQGYSAALQGTTASYTTALNSKLNGIEAGATADQTAAEILTAIKTVDGTGTGLDADLLDGQHGTYYTGYTDTAIANLVATAPATLDTLNELATALGNDPNFATTVTTSIGTKAASAITISAGAGMTGGGDLTANRTISHADTSTQASLTALTGANVISDVDVDTYGHVTAMATRTMTAADLGALTGNQTITLSGDLTGSGTTAINAQLAANVVGANELNVVGNGTTAQYLRSDGDGTFTWATPTDTNTTYTASHGLSLSGTDIRYNGFEIPSAADLNTYRTTGYYTQNANADAVAGTNYPVSAAGILQVINDDYGNGVHTTQLYSQYNTTNYFIRTYYNGTWSAWRDLTQDTNTTYTAGTALSLVGTTFNNTAPDQTVTLTQGGATTITGTYPNFTISSTDTNTTYSVGNGGLTEINFTTALNNKLAGIEAGATADQTAAEILTAIKTVDGAGSGLDADLLDGYNYTDFNGVVARWTTSSTNSTGRLKLKLPFATNSALMLKFTISQYTSYTQHDYEVATYLYPAINNWYSPTAVYTGTGSPDIIVGREADGKAYVSIADSSYTGVIVHSLTIAYIGTEPNAYDQGWVITQDATTPNSVSVAVRTTWNNGNDGSGSGLDADLLDGQQGSYYQPASTAITTSNIGSQSVSYAATAGRAYPKRVGNVDLNFNWSGQSGQPPWLWGGSDGSNMYVYNPSNFSVAYAASAGSAGPPAHDAVGSVAFLMQYPSSTSDIPPGSQWAGSSLSYAGMYGVVQSWGILAWHNARPPGTWRTTGGVSLGASGQYRATTWVRIA